MATNWAGNVRFGERELACPRSVEELQEIVRSNDRVKALGTRHSFSTVADTTGVLVDVTGLPRRLEIDRKNRTATVSAATPYAEVALALDAEDLALKNMGSLPHISVGGAAATGTHGSGDGNQVLAASVAALDLVGADGELRHLDRTDPGFEGSVVSLGALGIVTALTIDVVPAYDMRQDVFVDAPWYDVLAHLDGVTGGRSARACSSATGARTAAWTRSGTSPWSRRAPSSRGSRKACAGARPGSTSCRPPRAHRRTC